MRRYCHIVILVVLLAGAESATAQVVPGDALITVTGGYAFGKSAFEGKTVDGGSVAFSFDKLGYDRPLSVLFAFAFSSLDSDEQEANRRVKRSIWSVPFFLGAKYWFGEGKVQGYAGAALGVYFSTLNTTIIETDETYSSVVSNGWGLGVPLGLSAAVSSDVLLTGGFSLNWLWENEFFENDLLYSVNLGLTFKT